MIAVGLMSGTSLDGIDAALVRLRPAGTSYRVDLLHFETFEFPSGVLGLLREALPPKVGTAELVSALNVRVGELFAHAALAVAGEMPLDFVATHGQTIFHDGRAHHTLQVGDPFVIRERTQCSVCFDFRSADCAAGGHGAPLVPYVDALLLGDAREDRVAVNIGGIANLTVLAHGRAPHDALAFDTGPGNMLIDAFVLERTKGAQSFDRDGALALRGTARTDALDAMLQDPYFAAAPPKSTGREQFGAQFLASHAAALAPLSLEDGCATLAALTAHSVARAIAAFAPARSRVLLSGGGARNPAIVQGIRAALPGSPVESTMGAGLDPDAKEAIAFAVLGYELLRERPANVPKVTGAREPVVLGAIAPHDLPALLAKVQMECRRSSSE